MPFSLETSHRNSLVPAIYTEDPLDGPQPDRVHIRAVEELPPSSPDAAVTSDDDATISDLGLDDEEAAALFGNFLAMGFDGKKVLLAIIAAKGDGDAAVDYLLNGMPQQRSSEEEEEFNLRDSSDAALRPRSADLGVHLAIH